ncbi:MAG: aminotransferase class I/II-fold pyridoxal phosphate-dependent enzyme [Acidimicrobiales bacterium]|nr:aminotransferase class I/II-fold pyridoxal phosphate-dependent enzyme [Acidimicrobiales bacterium]
MEGVRPADRYSARGDIEPFHVMESMNAAAAHERAGNRVLHLEVGQPSTPAPLAVRAAAKAALDDDIIGYTGALGTPELRERIARWYHERYGIDVDPARVVVTTGASGSCVLAFLALWDPGQRVGVIEPSYPCYRNDLKAFGIDVVSIPVDAETDFRPTVEQLDAAGPLDGLILASPSNPTGVILHEEHLTELLGWASAHAVHVIVDEIYHGLTFDIEPPTALAVDDEVVVFNSFSKYFSMTGWRLGWIVAPPTLIPRLERLAQNLTISAPTLSQRAGIAAFDAREECDENVARYRRNRNSMLGSLRLAGFHSIAPAEGAFYLWVDIAHTGFTASELCRRWLEELDIAATPGIDFDPVRGERFVRLSIAGSEADIDEAGARLIGWARDSGLDAPGQEEEPG